MKDWIHEVRAALDWAQWDLLPSYEKDALPMPRTQKMLKNAKQLISEFEDYHLDLVQDDFADDN